MRRWLVLLALLIVPAAASAQTNSHADDVLEAALVHWRAATWYAHIRDDNVTGIELDAFRTTWQAVAALPADAQPSLYEKDPQWPEVTAAVGKLADQAVMAADGSDTAAAETALIQVDDALTASRRRAGSTGFSDSMHRFRDAVTRLTSLISFAEQRQGASFDAAQRAQVKQAADACAEALTAMTAAIPPRWAGDEKLKGLIRQNEETINSIRAGLDRGLPGLDIAAAINVERSNYYLLFLGYG